MKYFSNREALCFAFNEYNTFQIYNDNGTFISCETNTLDSPEASMVIWDSYHEMITDITWHDWIIEGIKDDILLRDVMSAVNNEYKFYFRDANHIIFSVSALYKISELDILSKSRLGNITEARKLCIYLIRKYFKKDIDYLEICKIFNITHSYITYSIKSINNLLETDINFRNKIKIFIDN